MLKKVDLVKTQCTSQDFVYALFSAWTKLFGQYPSKEAVGVVFAQWGIETGAGQACWNWNVGNYKVRDKAGVEVKYFALPGTWEIIGDKKVIIPTSDPGSWFLAFDTCTEGMTVHLNFLANQRYAPAWKYVLSGDVAGFSKRIRQLGYYTASEQDYTKGMNYYFRWYMKSGLYEEATRNAAAKIESQKVRDVLYTSPDFSYTPELSNEELPKPKTIWQSVKSWFQK